MKKSIKQLIPICCFFFCSLLLNAQILTDYPCFAVANNNGAINNLHMYNPENAEWNLVGNTGTSNIAAIAADSKNGLLYTVSNAEPNSNSPAIFGIIDLATGFFTDIGLTGEGTGDIGNIQLNQIEGLAYDQTEQTLYAVHQIKGNGPGTNDLLFQIDVATGSVIPGAMLDSNGVPADYSVIPEIFDGTQFINGTNNIGDVYDVSDIAILPALSEYSYGYSVGEPGDLFAIQDQNGPGTLTILNKKNGQVENVVYDYPDDDVESIGFTHLGELYATTGDNGYTQQNKNTFIYIDLNNATTSTLSFIDEEAPFDVNFESFDCFYDKNTVQVQAPDFACYAVAKNNGIVNNLFQYDTTTAEWQEIGNTGTNYIGAIATDSENGILYTVESASTSGNATATFGTIDVQTGAFSAIGPIGTGTGDYGTIQLNQIEGLSYDQEAQTLYAVHKVDGTGPGTNDLLFQIDVATGKIITNAMFSSNGNADYAIIEEVYDISIGGEVYDVSDIAIYPASVGDDIGIQNFNGGELIAMHAENGPGVLSRINKRSGELEAVLFDVPDDDIESLGFTHLGDLIATTGDDGITQVGTNTFILLDVNEGYSIILASLDEYSVDFESIDCFHSIIKDEPKLLCQAVLELPRELQTTSYEAEEVITDKGILNYTAFGADIIINASKSVRFENVLISKNCNLEVDIDTNLCD